MKTTSPLTGILALFLLMILTSCRMIGVPETPATTVVSAELTTPAYLSEIVRYLYRWQLTEGEVESIVGSDHLSFWIRSLEVTLDPGDRSELAEVILPQVGIRVKVKKANYTLEETGAVVTSGTFRIIQVLREPLLSRPPPAVTVVSVETKGLRDYLFKTRAQHDYPDPVLLRRLQEAVRKQADFEGIMTPADPSAGKVVHVAPLSPVANEVWVFWEGGNKLFLFASDIDLSNPGVWQHEALMSRIFDLNEQVIVSPEEAPGSNRFLTRYQVSRALFNCVLLGQRVTVYTPGIEK